MYFICNLQTLVEREQREPRHLAAHLDWLREAHHRGELGLSGPRPGHTDGHYIISADSREEAERIARSDPHTMAGYTRFELIEWSIRRGSIVVAEAAQPLGAEPRSR